MITASSENGMRKYQLWKKRPTFEYRVQWNIIIRKNKFLYEKINDSVGWNKHSGEQHWSSNNTMSVMLCTGATFVKNSAAFVKNNTFARIVSFDTAGLHLLTFHFLEPYFNVVPFS